MDIGAKEIRQWHLERGWSDIGYHYVIRRNGLVEHGRSVDIAGAHAKGHNKHSIGVCLVGGKAEDSTASEKNFTAEQWAKLRKVVEGLTAIYQGAEVIGHNQVSAKDCPCFDVPKWWRKSSG